VPCDFPMLEFLLPKKRHSLGGLSRVDTLNLEQADVRIGSAL